MENCSVARASLDELRAVIAESDTFTPAFAAILDLYLARFAMPSDVAATRPENPCLKCGTLYAGFRWGIHHGCGYCSKCGWPARAYHFIADENAIERRIVVVLQYHPAEVRIRAHAPPHAKRKRRLDLKCLNM